VNAVLRLKNHRWVVVITRNNTVVVEIPFEQSLQLPAVKAAIRHELGEQQRTEGQEVA
jgi:hypothetical protein